ncbi:MAG: MFS transporter [Shimia sp.]
MTPRPPSFLMLVSAAAVAVMSLNMFLPALPMLADDLGVSYATASYAVSGYLAITAVMQLILGPMSDRYGRRPVVLGSLGVFTITCILCALATSFEVFLTARFAMGVVIVGSTVALATVRDTSDAGGSARRISWIAMGMAVGPMLGPVLGGALEAAFDWRAIFWALAAAGAALTAFALLDWRETNVTRASSLTEQARAYPDLLSTPDFWAYALSIVTGIGLFYVFITGAPLVAVSLFGLGAAEVGVIIGAITLGFFVGNAVSGRYAEAWGLGRIIFYGRATQVAAIAAMGAGLLAPTPWTVFAPIVLVGFGNGLANPSGHAGVMSVRPDIAGSASGLAGAMIMAGGALLTALAAPLLDGVNPGLALWVALQTLSLAGCATGIWCLRLGRAQPA